MPWRKTRDPYRVWLSEVMLQQTQVATVIPYYARFLVRFPTLKDLAAAELDEVLKLWSGLGYYSRARNLHRAAQVLVQRHGGKIPASRAEMLEIPGIGEYTAGAVLSIAYGMPEPLVDGNVARVLSRLLLLEDDWRSGPGKRTTWEHARQLVTVCAAAKVKPGDLNQALMDLGATLCTPASPACLLCPISRDCLAYQKGVQESYPKNERKAASPSWPLRAWLVEDAQGRILFAKRQPGGLFGGLWEVPTERINGATKIKVTPFATVEHILTHRVLKINVCHARSRTGCQGARPAVSALLLASAGGKEQQPIQPAVAPWHPDFPCWSGSYTARRWLAPEAALHGEEIALPTIQRKILRAFEKFKNGLLV